MSDLLRQLLETKGLRLIDLARRLGVNKATVSRWSQGTIPANRAVDIESATDIPREQLRPDLYREKVQ